MPAAMGKPDILSYRDGTGADKILRAIVGH